MIEKLNQVKNNQEGIHLKKQKKPQKKQENPKKVMLFQRRKEFASLYYQGFELLDVVKKVSKKYKIKKPTLVKDWERKSSWLNQIFYCSKKEAENELLIKLNLVEKACWETHRKANDAGNFNASVGALGKLIEVIEREADFVNNCKDFVSIKDPFMLDPKSENKLALEKNV